MKLVALAVLALGTGAVGSVQDAKRDAVAVAEAWLVVADSGKYDESWDELSPSLKKQLDREQWRLTLEAARSATGKLTSRKLKDSRFTEILAGAPDGTYVVVRYGSEFEKKPGATELVTLTLDPDGKWRVCGYHVRWKPEP